MYKKNESITTICINNNEILIKEGVFSQRSILIEDEEKTNMLKYIIQFINENDIFNDQDIKDSFLKYNVNHQEILNFILENKLAIKLENSKYKKIVFISNIERNIFENIFNESEFPIDITFISHENYKNNLIFQNNIDFVVMLFDRYSPKEFHEFNYWANENKYTNQISFLDNNTGYVFPINKPKYTVCYNEVEIHLEATMKKISEMLLHKENILKKGNTIKPLKTNLIIQIAILVNLINTFNTYGFEKNILTFIDYKTMNIEKTKVFKMPYCTACNLDEEYTHIFL